MTLRDWVILSFTFFIGILSGMYFYVTSFKPIYEEGQRPEREIANENNTDTSTGTSPVEQADISVKNFPGEVDGESQMKESRSWRGVRGFIEDSFINAGFDSNFK